MHLIFSSGCCIDRLEKEGPSFDPESTADYVSSIIHDRDSDVEISLWCVLQKHLNLF